MGLKMSELISDKEAKLAWANGEVVQWRQSFEKWNDLEPSNVLGLFDCNGMEFRLKPRTITLNGIEVPAPDQIEADPSLYGGWAINIGSEYYMYKNKSDYNIVVAALRSVFGKK